MKIHDLCNDYCHKWEKRCYKSGIPDECHRDIERNRLAPSYRQLAIAILKNDFNLKSLGYTPMPSKYYDMLKKIELQKRGVAVQLKLFY